MKFCLPCLKWINLKTFCCCFISYSKLTLWVIVCWTFGNDFIWKDHNHAILFPTHGQFQISLTKWKQTYPSLRRSRNTTSKQVKVPVLKFQLWVYILHCILFFDWIIITSMTIIIVICHCQWIPIICCTICSKVVYQFQLKRRLLQYNHKEHYKSYTSSYAHL